MKKFFKYIFSIEDEYKYSRKVVRVLGLKFTTKKDLNQDTEGINARIKQAKYVHIIHNDKFDKPFVDSLNKNFNTKEHLVLCKPSMQVTENTQLPTGDNVIIIKTLKSLDFSCVDKIFFHSLFDSEYVDYLWEHKDILQQKAYWCIWGGDLYNAKRDEKNDFVRANFKGYLDKIDEDYARKKYGIKDKTFFDGWASFPLSNEVLDKVERKTHEELVIQINNSADDSTLEMLEVLSKFKNENIKVVTVLSYGKLEYKDKIIKKGKEIFGDKFSYLNEMMDKQSYANHLANIDILILNQNRQQGVGNTVASLYLGNKVFIKSDVATYKYLNEYNYFKVFDSNMIKEMSFDELKQNDFVEQNKKEVQKCFDEKYLNGLFQKVLDD